MAMREVIIKLHCGESECLDCEHNDKSVGPARWCRLFRTVLYDGRSHYCIEAEEELRELREH